ncbi:MAG: bifunctional tetrahydrofolate synthase/dihydrofolate synthase [Burkholderiaceae bacterium]
MSTVTTESPALAAWLARIERLHPTEIELGLDRVRRAAQALAIRIDAVRIVVAGTNGKGSVCAMLDSIARCAGYRVGLYGSPHLLRFNERIRIDGREIDDGRLIAAFEAVEAARGDISLTYFEFTTLAALWCFAGEGLDLVVLEVGLGGRLDAVNIVDADCAVLTSIALDHRDWLGDSRESVGREKAHVFRAGRPAICADPDPPTTVIDHAAAIGADLWLAGRDFNVSGDRQQWAYGGRAIRRNALAFPALRGANQLINAGAVLAAFEALRERLPIAQQAVREGFAKVALPGRFEIVPGRPAIVLDVAHNPHAAAHLAVNLDRMGFFPVTHAVFGVMRDKDIDGILAAIGDRIDHWWLFALPGARAADPADLLHRLRALGYGDSGERTAFVVDTAAAALSAARSRCGENDRIVVFGSFVTVAEVMKANVRAYNGGSRPSDDSGQDGHNG